jgi:hypothetical protein
MGSATAASLFDTNSTTMAPARPPDDFPGFMLLREQHGCKVVNVFPSQDEISRTYLLLGDRVDRFPLSSSITRARLTNGSGAEVEMSVLALECLAAEQPRPISRDEF